MSKSTTSRNATGTQRTVNEWVEVLTAWVAAGGERSGTEVSSRTYALSVNGREAWARMVSLGVVRREQTGQRTVWRLVRPGDAPLAAPVIASLPAPGPVPEVVALCRELLARAEAGDVIGIAIAAAHHGRATGSSYSVGEGTVDQLVCGLERCKLRVMAHPDGVLT